MIRDIGRKCEEPDEKLKSALLLATRVRYQTKGSKNKVYSLHEPHVECLSKGKARRPYEFGNKVSFTVTAKDPWVIGAKSFFGNPFDGSTLREAIEQTESVTGVRVNDIFVDKGYRGKVHHPQGKRVLISGRKRLRPVLQRFLRRRSSVEPVIGHIKQDHRMARNCGLGVRMER